MRSVYKFPRILIESFASMVLVSSVFAQTAHIQTQQTTNSKPQGTRTHSIGHSRATESIKTDGRLDESARSEPDVAGDFRKQEPNEGVPASEKTELRLLFHDKNLYVRIHAFDS